MGIFKGKAPDPGLGRSSSAESPECRANGWCDDCGGVGKLGNGGFGGKLVDVVCRECGGSGKAK